MTNDEYEYTTDWFSWSPPIWTQVIAQLPQRKRFLEIGSFEGRSAVWLIENAIDDGGELICVDTWEGGEEHATQGHDMGAVEDRFHKNITLARSRANTKKVSVTSFRDTSVNTLAALLTLTPDSRKPFDFIYIDGSHQAPHVLTDACMSWELLAVGGVLVFDDYGWGEPLPPTHKPKIAIDAFTEIYKEKLHIIHKAYQLIIQKMKD
jgi:predicted O-methyltransferase YrrM